jgi:hypothetical protein
LRLKFRSTWRAFEWGRASQAEARAARVTYRRHVHWAKKRWWRQQQIKLLELYFSSSAKEFWTALAGVREPAPGAFAVGDLAAHFSSVLNTPVAPVASVGALQLHCMAQGALTGLKRVAMQRALQSPGLHAARLFHTL